MGQGESKTPELVDGITRLAELVMSQETVQSVLDLVVGLVEQTIPAADGASVTVKRGDRFATVASTAPVLHELDQLQYGSGGGPCVQAFRDKAIFIADDLATDERWPRFAAASAKAGFFSIMAIPLIPVVDPVGTLNVYASSGSAFDEVNQKMANLLANQAAIAIANSGSFMESEQSNGQLREALASRDVIGQAKGILMERNTMSGDEAFDLMRVQSQETQRKLRDIAEGIVREITDRTTAHD